MSRANCFIVLPEAQGTVEPGEEVQVELLPWARISGKPRANPWSDGLCRGFHDSRTAFRVHGAAVVCREDVQHVKKTGSADGFKCLATWQAPSAPTGSGEVPFRTMNNIHVLL